MKPNARIEIINGYTKNFPWSYGGVSQVHEYFPQLSLQSISKILSEVDVYTRFKKVKRQKKFSPIFVFDRRELWQADTVYFTNKDMVKANNGYAFLFTIIDCFSKFAWAVPMQKNSCKSTLEIFKQVVEDNEPPEKLNTDRGTEIICKDFISYLKQMKIKHYVSYSLRKCPIIERFNLTLQNILYKMMAQNKTYKWVNLLDNALNIYRTRKHRTIKMSPENAEKNENSIEVRANLLDFFHKKRIKSKVPMFKLGDTVRMSKYKNVFHRGYAENNTDEYFTIISVNNKLPGSPRYILKDTKNDIIKGSFFEEEIIHYKPGEYFDIQILNERGRGKKKQYFVHYAGYPSSFDEWTNAENLKK